MKYIIAVVSDLILFLIASFGLQFILCAIVSGEWQGTKEQVAACAIASCIIVAVLGKIAEGK